MNEIKKYNDVILEPVRKDDALFGSFNGIDNGIRNPRGNWHAFLPEKEFQSGLYFDTWNCIAEAETSTIEGTLKAMFFTEELNQEDKEWFEERGFYLNGELNFSARALGALSGTKVGVGNSGANVARAACRFGLMPESKWLFDLQERDPKKNNPEEYYKQPSEEMMRIGREFNERFELRFETVWAHQIEEALKVAPVTQFVYAWLRNSDGLYHNPHNQTNHAIVRINLMAKQVFDTYAPTEKALTDDYYYYPTGYKFNLVKLPPTMITLKHKYRYVVINGTKKEYGFYKANNDGKSGKFYTDDRDAILNTWIDENDGDINKKSVTINDRDWKAIQPKFNLRGEEIK